MRFSPADECPATCLYNLEHEEVISLKRTVSAALAAIFCLGLLTGCSTMKTTWRSTRKLYRKYVNVDPTIDLAAAEDDDKALQRLGALFMPVDEPLMKLTRLLNSQDTPPENDWVQQQLTAFPWLSGLAVLDTSGLVKFQVPSTFMRPMDFTPLLELADRYKARQLGAVVKTDELGTVVMVAGPYFENNEWTGLIVAFFDPRSLLRFSPDPGALVVLSSDGTVWPGGSEQASSALTAVKWDDILKDDVQGDMTAGGTNWVWVSRYLGQLHVIYLTDAKAARAEAAKEAKAAEKAKAAEAAKAAQAAKTAKTSENTAPEAGAASPGTAAPVAP